QSEPGLLYPDGYQYLLMAKGIAAHGRPLLTLGPGGDTLLPNADAAAKPFYPALVALLHLVGLTWFAAARTVTALAAACTIVLTGLVARRISGSWLAAGIAATACAASRELTFWSGFAGPDALGQALGLASVLAFLDRRPRLGGVLASRAQRAPSSRSPGLRCACQSATSARDGGGRWGPGRSPPRCWSGPCDRRSSLRRRRASFLLRWQPPRPAVRS